MSLHRVCRSWRGVSQAWFHSPTCHSPRVSLSTSTVMLNKPVDQDTLTHKATEHISFDPKFIRQEPEDERAHFQDYIETFGEHRFGRPPEAAPERQFTISEDPEEWQFVSRLFPKATIPEVPDLPEYPSGFVKPTAKPGDYRYHVRRTVKHMLPVYANYNAKTHIMRTQVAKVDGDLFALRDDLKEFLHERYQMDFMCQVGEVYGKVIFRGDFEQDFKEFLIAKGF